MNMSTLVFHYKISLCYNSLVQCNGGVGIGGDTPLGYVAFTTKESGHKKKRFIYYQDAVLSHSSNNVQELLVAQCFIWKGYSR